MAVRRQEVYPLSFLLGLAYHFLQGFHGSRVGHPALAGHVCHAVHLSEPYDILYADIISYEIFLVFVDVYHPHQSFAMLPVEVQERAVLTESVYIGRIVCW